MPVAEQVIGARAVKAEGFVINPAVICGPRAGRRSAEGMVGIVDNLPAGIAKIAGRPGADRMRWSGNAVGGIRLGPAPGIAVDRAGRPHRVPDG